MRNRTLIFLSILVLLAMACNLLTSTGTTPQEPAATQQEGGNQPGGDQSSEPNQPAGTPPADPVSINEGLSSLNSYEMIISFTSSGTDSEQPATTSFDIRHSKDADATHTHIIMEDLQSGGEDSQTNESDIYHIGNDQCSGSGEDWSWTSNTPAETEMLGVIKGMLGFTPLIDNPTYVGQETVNGIQTNHFTFKVSGLGATSGAEVKTNQGDYWLAVDGQYIVKYSLILEESTSADAKVLHVEVSIDLSQINQPISIAFPQGCLDASLVTPTP